jgi:hypothetical protein
MFLLLAFLAISWLLRKSFCAWLCPVGTISEWLWRLGRRTFHRNWRLPRWLDIPLRSLKYILLGLFLYAVGSMSVPAIQAFLEGPYGLVSDVKMLDFLPFPGHGRGRRDGVVVGVFHLRAELLVPLSLPLRSVDGSGRAAESAAHPARGIVVHRLRQVCESLPCTAARR